MLLSSIFSVVEAVRLFTGKGRSALAQKRFVERPFEFPELPGLPGVGVARLKPGSRIAGLTRLEFTIADIGFPLARVL